MGRPLVVAPQLASEASGVSVCIEQLIDKRAHLRHDRGIRSLV
jgi:hypothetical protein